MARLKEPEDDLSQEDEAKTRRTFHHHRSSWSSEVLIKLPNSWRIHDVFHAALLRPYKENDIYGENYPEPPPELVEGEEVYEVESILNHRKRGRGYQYYVKWKGYPISDASWDPEY